MSARNLLTARQQQALDTFMEISAIQDVDLCISILANHSWNVDMAVANFVGQQDATDWHGGAPGRSNSSGAHRRVSAGSSASNIGSGNFTSSASRNSPQSSTSSRSVNQGNAIDLMLKPIQWLFRIQPQQVNPAQDARKFIEEFDESYSPNHPQFCSSSYQEAVQQAYQSSKFLVVYLHSPLHEDTPKFCRQVLCTRNVSLVLGEHAVVWAGSVWAPEAYELSTQLRVSSFPFVAVLVCPSVREVNVVDRIQGYMDETPFTERLENCIRANNSALNAVRLTAARLQESNDLRAQQDREFRDMEESTRREAERRVREATERAVREEEERNSALAAEQAEQAKRQQREVELRRKKEMLLEPPNTADAATIRFQLPLGAKLSRRFLRTSTVKELCDFLDVHFAEAGGSTTRFAVSSHFPKVELTDMTASLEQLVSFMFTRSKR